MQTFRLGVELQMGRFEVYQSKEDAQWRWRFVTGNNKTIAHSGEGYHNYEDYMIGIRIIRAEALGAQILKLPQPV